MPRPRSPLMAGLAGVVVLAATALALPDEGEGARPAAPPAAEAGAPRRKVEDLPPEEREKVLRQAVKELAANLGGLKTLRAEFVQRKHLDVFREVVESRGTLCLEFPRKLRWEFASPVKSVLVVNGDRGKRERISRKGEKTTTRFDLSEDPVAAGTAGQVFLWTRGDLDSAGKDYVIGLIEAHPLRIRATPRDSKAARVVSSVELLFSEDRKSLLEVVLVEEGDARTVISFSGIERDKPLPAALFDVGG